jgi:hypothetical protein
MLSFPWTVGETLWILLVQQPHYLDLTFTDIDITQTPFPTQ